MMNEIDSGARRGFWVHWRRGWYVLLFVVLDGVFAQALRLVWKALERQPDWVVILAAAAGLFFVLPALTYWLFALFFGHSAWPFGRWVR